jgi:hypothetical protein
MRIKIGNWDTATLELKYLKFLDPFKSVLSVLSVVRFGSCAEPHAIPKTKGRFIIRKKQDLSSGGIIFRAVIHSRVGLSFSSLVGTGSDRAFFLGCRLGYAQSDIRQFQKAAAVGRATRTIFPGALSRRPLEAISRRDPEVFGDLRLLV